MTLALPFGATERPGNDVARWTASLAVVLALHGLGAAALLTWHSAVEPILLPPPAAIMIDLAPMPVPLPVAVPPVVEPPKPPEPEKQVIPEPLPTPAPKPEVVLPPPKPKIVHKVTPPPPKPEVEPTPVAPTPPAQPPQQAVAPTVAAPPAPAATPSYQGLVMAQLLRNKDYPREARMRRQQGIPVLRFTLKRDGSLVGATLERSSGFPLLDEEVLAMVRRAAPLPPFPADMPQATQEWVVPVRFELLR